jgi:hypothetical protein
MLSSNLNTASLVDLIGEQLQYPGGDTNLTMALEIAMNEMYGSAGDRRDIPNVVVVITDGIPTFPKPSPRYVFVSFIGRINYCTCLFEIYYAHCDATFFRESAISAASQLKTVSQIFTIGITNLTDFDLLSRLSSGGEENVNWFSSPTFEGLEEIRHSVVQETCIAATETSTTSITHLILIIIECTFNILSLITGCIETESSVDLVFVVDSSGSICENNPTYNNGSGCNNWILIVNFVVEFVRAMQPSRDGTHIGLLSFSDNGVLSIKLDG